MMRKRDRDLNKRLEDGISNISRILSDNNIIEPRAVQSIIRDEDQLYHDAEHRSSKLLYTIGLINKGLKKNIETYLKYCRSLPQDIAAHNLKLAQERAAGIGDMINPVEGHILDTQQLTSMALDVHSRLVLAGAGTGKTTTIVGFVKYLLASRKAAPEDILALSFTNAAVDELKERIKAETGRRINTMTFHRLGIKIITSVEGKVPKVSKLDLSKFISDEVRRRESDSMYMRSLNEYLLYDFGNQKNESSFDSSSEYLRYLKENPLVTLKDERVKSFGERDIANFLAVNGIPYEYEASYEKDTNDSQYGQYHPDFHLTGTDIYIEYFGIDRNGNVAKFMIDKDPDASEEYRSGIAWKRQIHRDNGTRLVELYAYNRSEGNLQNILSTKLKKLNINFNPSSPDKVFEDMISSNKWRLRSLISFMTTVITLVKETGKPWEEAYSKAEEVLGRRKAKRFEEVLKPVFDAYQKSLSDSNEIDFEDMLNTASEYIYNNKYHHPYSYVIVDEYQDLSRSRYRLLKSMRQDRDYKLYCVGDDWQSIYRFNGCDVSYILNFERYWGPSSICNIETTYRFGGDLLRLSSDFIRRNKRQYQKQLTAAFSKNCPVKAILASAESNMRFKIGEVLEQIPGSSSVLFLGRYNHDVKVLEGEGYSWIPSIGDESVKNVFYFPRRDLSMKFMTIHSSKGLQADYVISLNNKTGRNGFPGSRDESPVIKMLLDGEDSQYDEERRLFYVAMTRAKKCLYLASYDDRQSSYFKEIFNIGASNKEELYCPICRGQLVLKKGKFGQFLGCENYRTTGCKFTRNLEPRKPDRPIK